MTTLDKPPVDELDQTPAEGLDQPPVDGDTKWVCRNCGAEFHGDHKVASQHFEPLESWGHWIFEYRYDSQQKEWLSCQRSIHTSDWGGYYFDDWRELNKKPPPPVWGRFTSLLDQP